MAPTPDYNDDLLLLLVTLLVADRTSGESDELDPYLDQLLRVLEERSFERSEAFSRLPFPPQIIFRQLRSAFRRGPFERRDRRMQEMADGIYGRLGNFSKKAIDFGPSPSSRFSMSVGVYSNMRPRLISITSTTPST
jgi:hypothetical protein